MGGRHIDDHSNWIGKGKEYPLPEVGAKLKAVHGTEGAGKLGHYEDTNETIVSQQAAGVKKTHGHAQKPGHRN